MWNKIKEFFQEIRLEFKKVTWPGKAETFDSTKLVIIIVVIIALYLGLVDIVLSSGVKMLMNEPPVAVFAVDPTSGDVSTTFSLDASGSYDSEEGSSTLEVRWDFDGDGKWDEPASGYTKNKVILHKFDKPSIYSVRMEVKDSQGASAIAKLRLDVKEAQTAGKENLITGSGPAEAAGNAGQAAQTGQPDQSGKSGN